MDADKLCRYDRNLVQTTLKAMTRVSEIRARRERAFYKSRMRGNKARQLAEDRKLVEENQHLLPPSERWAVEKLAEDDMEDDVQKVREKVEKRRKELEEGMDAEESELESELEEELPKQKNKKKLRMKVGGGVEAMDVDA